MKRAATESLEIDDEKKLRVERLKMIIWKEQEAYELKRKHQEELHAIAVQEAKEIRVIAVQDAKAKAALAIQEAEAKAELAELLLKKEINKN